jgi:hypothetical protein
MADNSKKLSELPTASNAASSDRVLILRDPAGSPSTRTISVDNLTSSIRYANTSVAGIVKVGNNLSINATGYLNAQAGGANNSYPTPSITYTGTFGQEPKYWVFTEPKKLLQTTNNTFANSSNLYWLDQRFDDQFYDLSALESISFNNIGGITQYLDFSDKSELALESIDFGDITIIQDNFYLSGFGGVLQTVTANNFSFIGGTVQIYSNGFTDGPDLQFPSLQLISGDLYVDYNVEWNGLSNTAAPSFPALESVGSSVQIYNNSFNSYTNFTLLEKVDWSFYFYNNFCNENDYTGPGAPALVTVPGYLQYRDNNNMTSVSAFTNLTSVGYWIQFYGNPDLTALPSFPALQNILYGGIEAYDCTSMTTVGTFLPVIKSINGDVNFQNCALDQASVDAILAKLVSLDGTNSTSLYQNRNVYLHYGTNAIPSAQGLADVATLQGRGCNVYVNS